MTLNECIKCSQYTCLFKHLANKRVYEKGMYNSPFWNKHCKNYFIGYAGAIA